MARRFQQSVGPSVCPLVTLTKKAYSSIIDRGKIIRISGERAYHPLQESEAIFKKKILFKNFKPNFGNILLLCIKCLLLLHYK